MDFKSELNKLASWDQASSNLSDSQTSLHGWMLHVK